MNPINSHSGIQEPLSPAPKRNRLEEAATVVYTGRDVTPYYHNNSPFLDLPELIQLKIIRCLGLREITRLAKVCRYFRNLVKQDKALERAWYRRFPSPQQYQLRSTIETKDQQQLRDWLEPFADKGTIGLLMEQGKNIHFSVQLLFTNSKLMSLCKEFELVEKLEITHRGRVYQATLSPDGQHLATASRDTTAKIYSREPNGSWEEKAVITHQYWLISATFSPDGRYLIIAAHRGTVKIYGLEDDGSWVEKARISHERYITSATFCADGRRVMTVSYGHDALVKITGRGGNGSWELEDTFQKSWIHSAELSPDGRHLIIHTPKDRVIEIQSQLAAGLWAVTSSIQLEDGIDWAKFSADSCHLVISTFAPAAIIYDLQADGTWKEMGRIKHDAVIPSANFSADCLHLVTASKDNTAKIYSQSAGSWKQKACIVHSGEVSSASFSADCQHVVNNSDDATAQINSLQTDGSWALKASIVHQHEVLSATFSSDGCLVVTASRDHTAKVYGLWTDGSWVEKATIRHERSVKSATFSTDSRHVLTVSLDNKVRITELRRKN
ncbi:F-box/WD repeat-containing protein [Endozoicomonas sp. 8E]|uniref:F-box/WD repeat-containing protein n=1 Tax=Endozoicomonas sp. 8E TaxID=3035692 RepID=UPI002939254C|nr:F-box protein [Endozoicomonas sp. 8E]WOG28285.1 F-box protein [Endozoicomonas sp. 8E]